MQKIKAAQSFVFLLNASHFASAATLSPAKYDGKNSMHCYHMSLLIDSMYAPLSSTRTGEARVAQAFKAALQRSLDSHVPFYLERVVEVIVGRYLSDQKADYVNEISVDTMYDLLEGDENSLSIADAFGEKGADLVRASIASMLKQHVGRTLS